MHVSDANNKSSVEQVTTFLDANPSWSAEVPGPAAAEPGERRS
jgi:hypothetical protein